VILIVHWRQVSGIDCSLASGEWYWLFIGVRWVVLIVY